MKTALVVALCAGFAGHANASCADDRVTVIGDWGRANFAVVVVDDPAERSQGLMNVPEMATMSGMFFVYLNVQRVTFWMRNTLIPLDMIFARADGTVQTVHPKTLIGLDMIFVGPDGAILSIHENAVPLDETVINGGDGVQYVLEVNAGMVARLGINIGDSLQHPAFGEGAIVPCD